MKELFNLKVLREFGHVNLLNWTITSVTDRYKTTGFDTLYYRGVDVRGLGDSFSSKFC